MAVLTCLNIPLGFGVWVWGFRAGFFEGYVKEFKLLSFLMNKRKETVIRKTANKIEKATVLRMGKT